MLAWTKILPAYALICAYVRRAAEDIAGLPEMGSITDARDARLALGALALGHA